MKLSSPRTNPGGPSDVPYDIVQAHVGRILESPGFARSERLKRFLSYAVERFLAGDAGNLKEYSIALDVFDRSPCYNPKIDAIVRVEARRLRARLERYYATEGMHDAIRIEFPSGTYVPLIVRNEATSLLETQRRGRRAIRLRWVVIAGGLAIIALAAVVWRLALRRQATPEIVRLIKDSAAAFDPCASRDGRLLAYASDQSGNVDIWVRSLDSGEGRRLTSDQAVDASPDFSPDSSRLAFRSERNGGGVYAIPVGGGPERLVAPLGRSPKFSPDGKWIAFWTGESHHFEGQAFIVPSAGGKPIRVGADLADAKRPAWSPDGSALLVYGSRVPPGGSGVVPGPMDLFLLPVNGGPAHETGWAAALRRANIWSEGPVSWYGSRLQFSAAAMPVNDFSGLSQGVANLWRMRFSQQYGQVEGEPRRVTFGAALEQGSVLLPDGGAVLASGQYTLSAFDAALDDAGRPHTGFRPSFTSAGSYVMPRISRDGSALVALSDRSGQVDIWLKDLRTGEERALTSTADAERSPQISSDGATVFFGVRKGPSYPMYKVGARGGAPQKVCDDCGAVSDISADGKYVLYHAGEPWSAYSLNLATGNRTLIARHQHRVYSSRFSPDGRWITFHTDTGKDEAPRRIFVAPFLSGRTSLETEWIPVTDGEHRDFEPTWSADGAIIYFLSDRDGNRCIWATRVDRQTKHPAGEPFPVVHLHRMSAHIPGSSAASVFGVSAGRGRLVFGAQELSSTLYRVDNLK